MDGQYPGRYRSLGPLAGGGPKPGPMVGAAESLRRATAAGLKISLAPKAHHRVRTQSVRISATFAKIRLSFANRQVLLMR
jgi:hypothetical protein